MKRSSLADNQNADCGLRNAERGTGALPHSPFPIPHSRAGFTLVELMIATTVLVLVLTSLCSMYFTVANEWQRQDGRGTALAATSTACTKLSDYITQAKGVVVLNRFGAGDAIAVNLPANTANGIYVPTWSAGKVQYQTGNWIVFYLSNSSGSYGVSGNILWAATMTWAGFPGSVAPDSAWSLYYDQPKGRIAPISSLQFTLTSDSLPRVTIAATSQYVTGTTQSQVRLTRTVCLQNAY
jgi:prepilin-type N-terminal cleavage/methylation domain-containing protein